MDMNLTEAPELAVHLPEDCQSERIPIGTGDGYFPDKAIKDESISISAPSDGQDDQTNTCYMNGPDSISKDIRTLVKLASIEDKKYEKGNFTHDSIEQKSQINIIKGERDDSGPLIHSYVSDFKMKPEVENSHLPYTDKMRETKTLIDQKLFNIQPCYMDQDKPYELIQPKAIQVTSEVKVFDDFKHVQKSEVVYNNSLDGAEHCRVRDKVKFNCFVRLERLNPRYIEERTQPKSGAPDVPDLLPEGMSFILNDTGVWSARFLPKGTEFGPYDYSAVSSDSLRDGSDWTSFVRKSSGDNGHNIEVQQNGSKVFYKIVSDIQPQTELILLELRSTDKIHVINKDSGMPCLQIDSSVTNKQKHIGGKPHECKQCGKLFCQSGHLKNHMKSHTTSHQCSVCGKLFPAPSIMKIHMATHTKEKPFQCIECEKEFKLKGHLVIHMRTHSGEKPHECKQCGKFFSQMGTLKQHMVTHTGLKTHRCSECGKLFQSASCVQRHMVTHNKEKPFQCIECGKQFTLKASLVTHMLIHSGKKPHECKQCGKFFAQSGTLKQHMVTHTGLRTHECSDCGKLFSAHSSMQRHRLTHTKEKPFQCIECGGEFALKSNLVRHMLTHSGEKPHECKQCGKCFSLPEILKQHMTSHTGERTHKCSKCGKLFSLYHSMKRHMLTHTKEKQFQCIECGKEFKRKDRLALHMFTHSGEKPHGCKQCGKFFSLSGTLKQHMLTHTGLKPHECKQCGKFLSSSATLQQHMVTHTGVKSHKCSECGKLFSAHSSMRRHSATHKKENNV